MVSIVRILPEIFQELKYLKLRFNQKSKSYDQTIENMSVKIMTFRF